MRAAAIQLEVVPNRSKNENIRHASALLDTCKGCDFVVLPEIWNIGFYNFDNYYALAETGEGETMSAVSDAARRLGAYVYSGTFVEKRNGKYYNTGILFDKKGNAVAKYSKIHLFGYRSRETELITAGDEITVAETELGRIGLATCYDLRFPELFRKMTLEMGAEIFAVPAAWPLSRIETWSLLLRARAAENFCLLVSSNCTGLYNGIQGGGNSQIIAPDGSIAAACSLEETVIFSDFSLNDVAEARQAFSALDDVKLL